MNWISVEDELPKSGQAVIAYMADRKSIILTHFFDDFALARVGLKEGFTSHGVTHWLPLPEPPKE